MARPNKPPKPVKLPDPLKFVASPNFSDRLHGIKPYLIVCHRPVGGFEGSLRTLTAKSSTNPVSSHILTEGRNTGVDVATQLVEWHKKAWAAAAFNSVGYQLEIDDDAWDGDDLGAAFTAARIVGFLCRRTGIPPTWSKKPLHDAGVIRHYDLGAAGGGHTDPTTDPVMWRWFIRQCQREYDRAGYRKVWGRGKLVHI
jgi:hypothetical protein